MKYEGYKSVTGESLDIDVSPYWLSVLNREDRIEYNSRHKLERRSLPLHCLEMPGFRSISYYEDPNILALFEDSDETKNSLVRQAVSLLSEEEKDLVENIYFKNIKISRYAAEHGISDECAYRIRLRALKKLREMLESPDSRRAAD